MTDGQPPIHAETYEPRWVCPACGSDNIQGLAWVRLNGEGVESWIEGEDYWCPHCEDSYRGICQVDPEEQCLIHARLFEACRKEYVPAPPARLFP